MPLTFPSHAAAVLPLKAWRRTGKRRLDGVALVVGSMAPDLAYALDGSWLEQPAPGLPPLWQLGHGPYLLIWVPLVVLPLARAIRWAAPTVAAHLPRSWHGYGSIGRGPVWWMTTVSAVLGGASHAIWDVLAAGAFDLVSSLAGGLIAAALFVYFGQSLPKPSSLPARRPLMFWGITVVTVAAVSVAAPFLPGAGLAHTTVARLILAAMAGLFLACTAVALRHETRLCRTEA